MSCARFIPDVEAVMSSAGLAMFRRLTVPFALTVPPGSDAFALLMFTIPL